MRECTSARVCKCAHSVWECVLVCAGVPVRASVSQCASVPVCACASARVAHLHTCALVHLRTCTLAHSRAATARLHVACALTDPWISCFVFRCLYGCDFVASSACCQRVCKGGGPGSVISCANAKFPSQAPEDKGESMGQSVSARVMSAQVCGRKCASAQAHERASADLCAHQQHLSDSCGVVVHRLPGDRQNQVSSSQAPKDKTGSVSARPQVHKCACK